MMAQALDWRTELKDFLFTRDAHQRLWQIAFFATLMIPPMLIGHRTAAEFLTSGIGVLFLLNCASKKEWGWLRDPLVIVLFATWAWISFVVTPLAFNIENSASIAFPWIRFVIFFAAIRHWVFTEIKPFKVMALWMALILIMIVIDTMWQYVHGLSLSNHYMKDSGRLTGPFNNVKVGIYLSRMTLPVIGLCLFFSFEEVRKRLALTTYALLFCFILMTIAVSGERTPFSTASVGILVSLSMIALREHRLRSLCLALIAGTIGLIYVMIATQDWIYSRLVYTVDLAVDFRNTSYGQLFWMAWDMGKEHIVSGVGLKNFRLIAEEYVTQGLANHHNLHPHHPYLEWFAETGLIGLSMFIAFIAMLFIRTIRVFTKSTGRQTLIAAFAFGTLVLLFFPLAPTQSFFANWPAMVFWFPLSMAMASLRLCEEQVNEPGVHPTHG
ncbi:MAG: O-antigen ligase family protein [Alphaproteobacteria bacterium]